MAIKNTKKLIILFGSQATGKSGKLSDIDVAILAVRPLNLNEKINLTNSLAKKLKISEDKIDLVDLNQASPLLLFQVAKHGKLIFGRQDDFIKFKLSAWRKYQNTAKLRRFREQAINKLYA